MSSNGGRHFVHTQRFKIAMRRREVSELICQNLTQWQIAERLGVTQQCVSKDVAEIKAKSLASSLVNISEAKAYELEKINYREAQAWIAYRLSVTEANAAGEAAGDPRWMAVISDCGRQRRELMGYDAPKKQQISGPNEGPIMIARAELAEYSNEELAVVERLAERRLRLVAAAPVADPGGEGAA